MKDCGFGVGADAQCVTCRPNRYKDSWGRQKCKRCLSCPLVNRFQEMNCTVSSNAVCGKCLPGFYRKTRLGGLLDTECIPCSDPVTPNQSQCNSRTNVVRVLSSDNPPYDTALVAVICSALTTILLAVLLLCFIYCRRLIAKKQNNGLQRPPVNERPRVESLSSEEQMGNTSTEGLMKDCQSISAVNNSAQPAGPTDMVQPEDPPFTLRSCFVTYLCPSGSDDQDRSTVTCPAFSSSLPHCSPESQPLVQMTGCNDCPTPRTSNGGIGGEFLLECDESATILPAGGTHNTATVHCASRCQSRLQHVPVECTELDLQAYLVDEQDECTVVAQETAAHYQRSRPQERPATASGSIGPDPCVKESWMWKRSESRSEECHSIRCGNFQLYSLSTGNNQIPDWENVGQKSL
ncbi:tumor necrosis factor receptor superfamily member 27 isoform X2 [Pristis pectinata]|uniref:tumor necrosis factor receptor superfamily member 27 isoform X2 n=1 Tax=Pristis pectinata TaxID=685728 RepID=UPI00223E27D3|nr:tumor necrosis factor receptor superfamily member 27 isoform X2 [Pristis pectinata]